MQFKQKPIAALVTLALALSAGTANAALERMGPVSASPSIGGYPSWFMDKSGLAMEFCDPLNQAELNGGWCTLFPPTPATAPESFPNNFFDEHFYWDATNVVVHQSGAKLRFVMALEAAFTNGAAKAGDQMTFGRLRIALSPLPESGTYTVYHPYGVWTFDNQVANDRLFFTEDVGVACPGTFECTLGTSIGPFLLPSAVSGGAEVPPIPDLVDGQDPFYDALVLAGGATAYPGTGRKYIADPGRVGPVTGSPLPPFLGNDGLMHDHNTLRIEGPNGFVIDAPDNFSMTGRVHTGAIPGAVEVVRASYGTNGTPAGNKVDVFAKAFETKPARLPAAAVPAPIVPILGYYDAPCAGALTIDPVTGFTTVNPPPYTAPVGLTKTPMAATGVDFWGQSSPAVIPGYACVEDDSARDALGNVAPAYFLKKVVDDVAVSAAYFNGPAGGNLLVTATSSDPAALLTLAGYGPGRTGLDLLTGAVTIPGLLAPPAKVQVFSSQGGAIELPVSTAVGATVISLLPTAVADAVTLFEDCSAVAATSCAPGAGLVISPLANDTINGAPIPAGAVATITIVQASTKGTAVIDNVARTITYTPNANASGNDAIAYNVAVAGQVSNVANISITITPVNDVPVAVNDTAGAVRGVLNSKNVLANDTDPDGPLVPTGSARIVTGNANLGIADGTVYAGGVVTYTPPAATPAGTYTFTYNAVDAAGVSSANAATVSVVVSTAEAIVPQPPGIYTAKTFRWVVRGTVAPDAGQTITVAYANGNMRVNGACPAGSNATGTVIGTATVVAGAWLLDRILASAVGVLNPSTTGNTANFWCSPPTLLRLTSSLTPATNTAAISVK
jgi:hypothetical protein